MALPRTKALVVSRDLRSFGFEHTPPHGGCALGFSIDAWEQLGYTEGYKFLENRKILIMSMLRISISALWRRYSWFESMRGSQTLFSEENGFRSQFARLAKRS
jgi:hypothetical protein